MNDTAQTAHPSRDGSLYVHRLSARSLLVHVGVYELLLENSDRYVDLVWVAVINWTHLLHVQRPSGLLGRTWNSSVSVQLTAEDEDRYRERDGDVHGCNMAEDRHCHPAQV